MKRDLAALVDREHDVLVVGGGIAGAWTVWEAVSRGLTAALVEADDFGQAASWSSLKTAHGGLRHLQRADLAGFRESVRERRALLRVAPAIVRPVPFVVPCETTLRGLVLRAGGLLNDVLSVDRDAGLEPERRIAATRRMSPTEFAASFPGLPHTLARAGGFAFFDAQITHTERLVVALLRAAGERGAVIANHAGVESGEHARGSWSVAIVDSLAGTRRVVRARAVVNAAGRGIERVASSLGHPLVSPPYVRGMNLVLDRRIGGDAFGRMAGVDAAFGARHAGRYLFLVPWNGVSMIGTTYDDGTRPLGALREGTIAEARAAFPWAGIDPSMIAVVHCGFVPGWNSRDLVSRSFLLSDHRTPIVSVVTAKYTTARGVAERAIDQVARLADLRASASVSAATPLPHARALGGALADQVVRVREEEMAATPRDAVRGRLEAGARGPRDDEWAVLQTRDGWCDASHRAEIAHEIAGRRERNIGGLPPPV